MKIEINNRANYKIDLNLVNKVIREFARLNKIQAKEISIAFVSDAEIKKINQVYRGLNQTTDVLAFSGDGEFFGEIIIDYNQVKRQAGEFGRSPRGELVFILVHGLLHLLGYGDETEKGRREMIRLGEEFIRKFKMTNFQ